MSPELVLVDPELARIARARLRRPEDCLDRPTRARATSSATIEPSARRSLDVEVPEAALTTSSGGAGRAKAIRSRDARRSLATAARWLVMILVIAVPFLAFLPADDSNQPKLAPADSGGGLPATRQVSGRASGVASRRVWSGRESLGRPGPLEPRRSASCAVGERFGSDAQGYELAGTTRDASYTSTGAG